MRKNEAPAVRVKGEAKLNNECTPMLGKVSIILLYAAQLSCQVR